MDTFTIYFVEVEFSKIQMSLIRFKTLNKMELLQSQAPAERELLGDSAVRTLDIRV